MTGDGVALRLDDVGASSKRFEIYGATRVSIGRWRVPFPGNFLFLKYLPPIKRWGPYEELTASQWDAILAELERAGARMTVGITAGWVESDGSIVDFPRKFPDAARVIRAGVSRGLLEVANHGYTHCVLQRALFRPRLFSGNRRYHREFHSWLPEQVHREHVARAQAILQEFFGEVVVTFVPPGNVFSRVTLAAAAAVGLRYVSCLHPDRWGAVEGITPIDEVDVMAIHDRDIVRRGTPALRDLLAAQHERPFVTVRELGDRLNGARR